MFVIKVDWKLEDPEKNPPCKDKNWQQTQPSCDLGPGIEPKPQWWEVSVPITTVPSLFPKLAPFTLLTLDTLTHYDTQASSIWCVLLLKDALIIQLILNILEWWIRLIGWMTMVPTHQKKSSLCNCIPNLQWQAFTCTHEINFNWPRNEIHEHVLLKKWFPQVILN